MGVMPPCTGECTPIQNNKGAYDKKICMASFTLNELRAFARNHNKQHNVKISQKKVPLHNDLKQKGVKMPKHKA